MSGCRRWMPGNAHLAVGGGGQVVGPVGGAAEGGFPCNCPGDATLNQSKADIG